MRARPRKKNDDHDHGDYDDEDDDDYNNIIIINVTMIIVIARPLCSVSYPDDHDFLYARRFRNVSVSNWPFAAARVRYGRKRRQTLPVEGQRGVRGHGDDPESSTSPDYVT